MLDELKKASNLLDHALDGYLEACTAVRDHAQDPLFDYTLSTCMIDEMIAIANYEEKIRLAKNRLSPVINHSPFAGAHSLPEEVLGHIFHLAIDMIPCFGDITGPGRRRHRQGALARAPERFSDVCSRWRRVAFELPTLWRHVDINTNDIDALAYASARMARAESLLLDVHVIGPLADQAELGRWLTIVAPRMRSLTMIVCDQFDKHGLPLLIACLNHCKPGQFAHLTLWNEVTVDTEDHGFYPTTIDLHREAVYFPPARQNIYVGGLMATQKLSELHLTTCRFYPSNSFTHIGVHELAVILQSCPKLRVLRIGMGILNRYTGRETPPVVLNDLEVIDLSTERQDPKQPERLEFMLSLLAPGPKSLQLTLPDFRDLPFGNPDVLREFFARSNVASLNLVFTKTDHEELGFDILFSLAPELRVLVLEGYKWQEYPKDDQIPPLPETTTYNRDDLALDSRLDLDSLRLHRCEIEVDACVKSLGRSMLPPRALVFRKCVFMRNGEQLTDEYEIRGVFHGVSEDVRIYEEIPNPADNWSLSETPRLY